MTPLGLAGPRVAPTARTVGVQGGTGRGRGRCQWTCPQGSWGASGTWRRSQTPPWGIRSSQALRSHVGAAPFNPPRLGETPQRAGNCPKCPVSLTQAWGCRNGAAPARHRSLSLSLPGLAHTQRCHQPWMWPVGTPQGHPRDPPSSARMRLSCSPLPSSKPHAGAELSPSLLAPSFATQPRWPEGVFRGAGGAP